MTKDYKSLPRRSTRGGGSGKSIVTGIVIGLLMGIIIALGIALYLNRSPSPFVGRVQQPEAKKPAEAKAPETVKPVESGPAPAETKPGDKPRFDFYEILPGDKDTSRRPAEKASREAPPAATPEPVVPKAAEPVAPKAGPGQGTYYVQAGSFRSASDADNLKARLALMGLEASVAAADVPNVGTMYRVRLGPYKSSDEVTPVKNQLAQNGIQASVVKFPTGRKN